jgi:hypothetical protein
MYVILDGLGVNGIKWNNQKAENDWEDQKAKPP